MHGPVEQPPANPEWHELARGWYESLAESGQAAYYETSDWQAALVVADDLSRYLNSDKRSAAQFSAIWAAMTDLLSTEASRRRVRLEVDREPVDPDAQPAGVTAIGDYRNRVA
jgi:hypothetical protein